MLSFPAYILRLYLCGAYLPHIHTDDFESLCWPLRQSPYSSCGVSHLDGFFGSGFPPHASTYVPICWVAVFVLTIFRQCSGKHTHILRWPGGRTLARSISVHHFPYCRVYSPVRARARYSSSARRWSIRPCRPFECSPNILLGLPLSLRHTQTSPGARSPRCYVEVSRSRRFC